MSKLNSGETYNRWLNHLEKVEENHDNAIQQAIGGEFDAFGILERDLLNPVRVMPYSYVIDIGCGFGAWQSR